MCVGNITFHSCELGHSGVYTMVAENSFSKVKRDVRLSVHVEGAHTAFSEGVASREPMPPVPVADFGQHVADLHSNNNKPFREQYMVCWLRQSLLMQCLWMIYLNQQVTMI